MSHLNHGHQRIHSNQDLADLDLGGLMLEPLEVVISPEPDDIHLTTLEEALHEIVEDARLDDGGLDVLDHHRHPHHKRHETGSDLVEALTAAASQARLQSGGDSVASFASVVAVVDTIEPITGEEVKAHVVLTWEPEIAQRIIAMSAEAKEIAAKEAQERSTPTNKPFMIAMVGIPG